MMDQSMKAVIYTKYGGPEVLRYADVPKPVAGKEEVLVKVHAASVNSWDWDMLRGKPWLYRLLFGLFKPRHTIAGCDIAGRVEATGSNVTRFKPGDEVMGDISETWGGYAEYVCVKEKQLSKKPASLSFDVAACIPQAGVLALQAVYDKKILRKGDRVLINGAGGGVGTFALQLAKLLGAEVTCVDSADKLDMLLLLGADEVIDYNREDFTKRGKKYDLVIDVVASRSVFSYRRCLKLHGMFVMIGGSVSSLLQAAILGPLLSKKGGKTLSILVHTPNKNVPLINSLVESGQLKPVIDKVFDLQQLPGAMKYFGSGKTKGKIVIRVEDSVK
ncbi:MAG: NAD(P)-dependent alcohol dehydrogenase [Chitinophagaceae bacterium]|nr:NAD(P)-dependent alcohol dehydrogenase [Chitinophagaceae bacterium]